MNFTQFSSPFGGALAANQFAAAKFPPNLATANGQVLSLVSGGDGGMQFLRPMDGNAMAAATAFQQQQQAAAAAAGFSQATPAYITLPITMPGAKPGDAQQTVQIQVLNPNPIPPPTQQAAPKFQMGQMQIPIQGFQQGTTVLTVAYSPEEELMHNHGLPEGMTIVAALQPQDLQLIAQAQNTSLLQQQQQQQQHHQQQQLQHELQQIKVEDDLPPPIRQIKQETGWSPISNLTAAPAFGADIAEFLQQRGQSLNVQPFLKLSNNNNNNNNSDHHVPLAHGDHLIGGSIPNTPTFIKREILEDNSNDNTQFGADSSQADSSFKDNNSTCGDTSSSTLNESSLGPTAAAATSTTTPDGLPTTTTGKARKKRKYKSKPPKPKRQKPGQVHITTALDGTVLFCCPECHMAYPEKECLEQHLAVHKIERRFICDKCGAGLKRKEHLERHKLGHNPERPYICSVCMKGFKRKEHLNLHFVIHSGVKTEICGDCGKGFYRKDHLRKHIKSHMTKRLKEENSSTNRNGNSNGGADSSVSTTTGPVLLPSGIPPGLTITSTSTNSIPNHHPPQPSALTQGICLPQGVTIHVPTADNQTLPVQISLQPQLMTQPQPNSGGTLLGQQ